MLGLYRGSTNKKCVHDKSAFLSTNIIIMWLQVNIHTNLIANQFPADGSC